MKNAIFAFALLATPAFARWVEAIDIAGPGFINIKLKAAAKQQIVHDVLGQGARFGNQPSNGSLGSVPSLPLGGLCICLDGETL